MTSRERVMAVLTGENVPDRLPWLPELNDGFIAKVVETLGPVPDGIDAQTFVNLQIGADQLGRAVAVREVFSRVEVENRPEEGLTIYHTPHGDLIHQTRRDETAKTNYIIRHKLNGPQSIKAYHAMLDDLRFEPDYERAQRTIDQIGETGIATIDAPATPLMHLIMWDMGIEETLIAMFERTDEMVELMQHMHEKNLEYYKIAANGPGEVVRPMEDTSSKLTGPDLYAKYCVEYLNEYAEICHQAGKKFIVHMCGHLNDMLPVIKEVNLDGIEAVTPAPTGDADLLRMREVLGDIIIIGGVDPSRYALLGPEQMRKAIRETLEKMKGDRRFILGHEEIPVSAGLETVKAVGQIVAETAHWFYR